MTEKSLARGMSNLIAKLKRNVTSPKAVDILAKLYCQQAREIILARTIAGYGVNKDGGRKSPLKPLSANYIIHRQRNKSRLASYTRPSKSNLTFSGELLSMLREKRNRPGNWRLVFQGNHEGGISNAKLAQYVSRDRPFLNLDRSEIQELEEGFRKNFAALVKRNI
jgi:hypothetical protein